MENKASFSLFLCCFLLATFLFFPYGTGTRILLQDYADPPLPESDNGQTKAGVKRSQMHTAPSWGNSPPTPTNSQSWQTTYREEVRQQAEQEAQSEACYWTRAHLHPYLELDKAKREYGEVIQNQQYSWEGRNPPPASSARKVTPETLNANKSAGVRRSQMHTAPSWGNSPPTPTLGTLNANKPAGVRRSQTHTALSWENSPPRRRIWTGQSGTKRTSFEYGTVSDKQIMDIKRSLTFVLCCSLLSSILFFSYGTISRKLLAIQEDSNGQSKAGVRRSPTNRAPSWAGRNPPPASSARKVTLGMLNANKPAGVRRSQMHTAPSWGNSPPTPTLGTLNVNKPAGVRRSQTHTALSWENSPPR
ncbi:hypothetical protein V6N13_115733 [Hibiscus sabdariffa]|uniref:Transmembrane protein n=1 Tax=Hibiscus sabdariffa TaxID=183260 RepID=A0ABR2CTD1_9ROSI